MTRFKAIISLLTAATIVGSTLVVSRLISNGSSVFFIQFIAMLIASLILFLWNGKERIQTEMKGIGIMQYLSFLFQALFGVVLFRVFLVYGVRLTPAMDAGVILSLTPLVTVILSIQILKEKLGRREIIALFFASTGILIININSLNSESETGTARLFGNLLVLLAVIGESLFVVFSKRISPRISTSIRSFLICIFSVVLFLPFAIYELFKGYDFLWNRDFWLLAAYSGTVLTVLTYGLWFYGIVYVSGTVAAVFNTLIPVSSILLVFLFFGEQLNSAQMAGLLLVFSSIGMILFSQTSKRT